MKEFTFSDNLPHLVLEPNEYENYLVDGILRIKYNITSPESLLKLGLLTDALRHQYSEHLMANGLTKRAAEIKSILEIGYLMGSRMEKRNDSNSPLSLSVIGNFINSLKYEQVIVHVPHETEKLKTFINKVETTNHLLTLTLFNSLRANNISEDDVLFVIPDEGATSRYKEVTNHPFFPPINNVIQMEKVRDRLSGKIVSCEISRSSKDLLINNKCKHVYIVDDLCDGGRTFIEVLNKLSTYPTIANLPKHLVVGFGIFSKGFEELLTHFSTISVSDCFPFWEKNPELPQNLLITKF